MQYYTIYVKFYYTFYATSLYVLPDNIHFLNFCVSNFHEFIGKNKLYNSAYISFGIVSWLVTGLGYLSAFLKMYTYIVKLILSFATLYKPINSNWIFY
jgi:hypothetical protein